MHYTRKQNAILVCMHVHASMTKYGGIKKVSTNSVTACLGGPQPYSLYSIEHLWKHYIL